MFHDKVTRATGVWCLGLVCGAYLACAGSDRPEPSDAEAAQIAAIYVDGNGTPAGGAAGAGGSDGAGAGGGSSAGAGGGGTEECDAFAILDRSCSGGSCHGAGTDIGNFAESLEIAETFAGENPLPDSACADYNGTILNPDNPQQSLLVQKVNGAAPCGLDMPLAPPALTDDEVSCLVEWIGTL